MFNFKRPQGFLKQAWQSFRLTGKARLCSRFPAKLYYVSFVFFCVASVTMFSCTKNKQESNEFLVREWRVDMNTGYTIPSNSSKTAHAWSLLYLMDNNKLYYDIYFNVPSSPAETPSAVEIYKGTAVDNGVLFKTITTAAFNNDKTGGMLQLTKDESDSLKANGNYYMLIKTTQSPQGLVRGQVNKTVSYSLDVDLLPSNITPSPSTTATGKAYIRILTDNSIVSKVVINNLPAGDSLYTSAIINTASSASVYSLADVAADFNQPRTVLSTAAIVASIKADALSVIVKSKLYPNGLLKGTIR